MVELLIFQVGPTEPVLAPVVLVLGTLAPVAPAALVAPVTLE